MIKFDNPGHWVELKDAILSSVAHDLGRTIPGLSLRRIDQSALLQTDAWTTRKFPHWNWRTITREPDPKRFEVAIWMDHELCGIAYGRTRSGDDYVSIEYLERNLASDVLRGKVIDIAVTVLETYALSFDTRSRLVDPIPELVDRYVLRGYSLVESRGRKPYLEK